MFKEVNEDVKAKSCQIGIINKKIEFIEEEKKRTKWKYWSWKVHNQNKIKSLDGLNSRFELAGERISELEYKLIAVMQSDE